MTSASGCAGVTLRPRVCGDRCCAGWTLSPKTRGCTKPRCSPPCRNGALCRRFNRCVCRRGFHGYRCQLPMATLSAPGHLLTSINPTEFPVHLRPLRVPPQPALSPQRSTKPAASSPPPEPPPEPSDPNPTSAQADGEKDTKVPDSGPAKAAGFGGQTEGNNGADSGGGVSKRFLTREENQASPKSPTVIWLDPDPEQGLTASNQSSDSGSEAEERRSGTFETPPPKFDPGQDEEDQNEGKARIEEKERRTEERKEKKMVGAKKLSLREVQAVLLRKILSQGGRGDKMATLLMKHIERERNKVHSATSPFNASSSSSLKTSVKTFHTQKGQYSIHFNTPTADGQPAGGGARGGGGVETIQVMFTPTICKVRCSQDRCVNYCERGNVTTLYSGDEGGGRRDGSRGPGFRVFLCPLLCKNGGVCLQKDRCLCPPNFTGKFCQIPVTPTDSSAAFTNEIVKPVLLSSMASNQELVRSEFLLPLGRDAETMTAGAPSGPLVKVRVQHPPEANVKVHQVKVSGFTPTLRTLSSSSSSGSAGAPAPAGSRVLAQTVRGDSVYTQQSGFKYCFREVKDGQCSSPLPGLRSKEMCCRGIGKAWGIDDCVICPENTGQSDASCPVGFERANGTQCVDVNECLQPGLCENGICVNTRGSYSCVCRLGFILDASHGICISQSVISEEKGQCYRVLGSGLGPSSCSLPILKSITKQICCCSRVGKAWGPDCQRCPYFGSVAFKEICPAGPGYQYSPSTLKFNQRVSEPEGGGRAVLVNGSNKDNQGPVSGSRSPLKPPPSGGASTSSATGAGTRPSPPQPQPQPHPGAGFPASSSSSSSSSRPVQPGSAGTSATQGRTRPSQSRPDSTQLRPQPPSAGSQADRFSSVHRADPPPSRGDSLPAPAQPQSPERGSRPSEDLPLEARPPVSPTPPRVQTVRGVCESRPGVCGRGRCVDQPGGKHTCVCDLGFQLSSQRTHCQDVNECLQSPAVCSVGECVNSIGSYRCACPSGYRSNSQQTSCQDIDECQQNPCVNGRCDNTAGSYRCICRLGYRLVGNTCTDVDECADPLQCPGQECVNTPGSFRCVSCPPGHGLLNNVCRDVDECRQNPCSNGRCENTPGSYRCVCHHGYKLQNNTCTDVDECAEPSQCPGQMCVNSVGSYRCVSCRAGFRLTDRQCTDINECEDGDSCPGQRCVNTEGSYRCVDCRQGYHSVDGVCTDIDECASGRACEAERVCVNTVGSFRCDCAPGYRTSGLGRQCRDINECLEGDFCFSRGECVNTPGSYTCVCSQGFTLSENRTACLDVDECVKAGVCSDGRCVNTEGSFQCECQIGFTTNPEGTACLDVDECVLSGGSICGSQRCENTIGSYSCLTNCEPGYKVNHAGICEDINECANTTVCGANAYCQNLFGTYRCVCDQGFTSSADGKTCVDVDECVSLPGVCGSARCENVEGSFMCECDQAGQSYDTAARQCVHAAALETDSVRARQSSTSSSSFLASVVELSPMLLPLPQAHPGELRECYYNLAERGTCSLLATNTTQQECCCTLGQGWGLGCQYHPCPTAYTAEFLTLCPSGNGYVTEGPGAFSYRDVDECKRFHPEVCKNGVCVNNIPGYSCYCSSGYVYNSTLLECVDHDECEEESCVGGICVNTVGSYYCSCQPPLVLDDTQRNCVNSSDLNEDENLSLCWQHVTAGLMCQSALLGAQVTFTDCCCLYGQGWGMSCALCPATDTAEYASMCSSFPPTPLFPGTYPDSETEAGRRRGSASPNLPPYGLDYFPEIPSRDYGHSDYDDYSPAEGSRSGFRGSLPDETYRRPEYSTGYYSEGDYRPPDSSQSRPPPFRIPPDPRADIGFGVQPDSPPLSLAPLPGGRYEETEEEAEDRAWRPGPPFPPFTDRSGGGGVPRRLYERRYESYASLSTAEDCGILHGCENGRCIRVAEGYTCDCYQGYELDMTTMTCIDVNECEDSVRLEFPCVNARCVNTDGSYRCVCRRGYVMSRRTNHCVAA
ncbi:latent-transforming growth factor beta-binding protein 4 isoform X3 [Oreochromis niloticus]|uniref:latent-transforming growth factor beta-binding protein 4 isoform X3 n=1 Tax=Oreochromis niloticus TaxID=8128 RepID=UPI000905072F|nr:latent-transforming growth factor beta-binding protein 4 isoform X3 [Oreochromis niloticus]